MTEDKPLEARSSGQSKTEVGSFSLAWLRNLSYFTREDKDYLFDFKQLFFFIIIRGPHSPSIAKDMDLFVPMLAKRLSGHI